jgi:hypothetical protein
LAGDISYNDIGRRTGIASSAVRIILRNPIYTGWRVIDQKRDTSPSALAFKRDGRQGDRPKIRDAPDEIIRVKVIDDGLVSQADFEHVQQIMDRKAPWDQGLEPVFRQLLKFCCVALSISVAMRSTIMLRCI